MQLARGSRELRVSQEKLPASCSRQA